MFGSWSPRFFVLDSEKKTITYYQEVAKSNARGEYHFNERSNCKECPSVAGRTHCFKLWGHSNNKNADNHLLMDSHSADIKKK